MFIIAYLKYLLQLFFEILLYSLVIFKMIIDPDNNFRKES